MGKFKDALTGAPLAGKVVVIDGAAVRESSDGTADVLIDPDAKLISPESFKEFFAMEAAVARGPEPGIEEKFIKAKEKIVELEEKLEDYQHYEDMVNEEAAEDEYALLEKETEFINEDFDNNVDEYDSTTDVVAEDLSDMTNEQSLDFDEEAPAFEVKDLTGETLFKVEPPEVDPEEVLDASSFINQDLTENLEAENFNHSTGVEIPDNIEIPKKKRNRKTKKIKTETIEEVISDEVIGETQE